MKELDLPIMTNAACEREFRAAVEASIKNIANLSKLKIILK